MSAWLCNDEHFAFLARAAVALGLADDADALALDMKRENLLSLAWRYEDEPMPESIEMHPDAGALAWALRRAESPGFVAGLAACLDYQSCEHPTWGESAACAIVARLHELGKDDEPAYSAAPWGLASYMAVPA